MHPTTLHAIIVRNVVTDVLVRIKFVRKSTKYEERVGTYDIISGWGGPIPLEAFSVVDRNCITFDGYVGCFTPSGEFFLGKPGRTLEKIDFLRFVHLLQQ